MSADKAGFFAVFQVFGIGGSKVEVARLIGAEEILPLTLLCRREDGFESAQVCAGGVSTAEIDPDTMESRLRKGLYLAGELTDADGICGGYNICWAVTTGRLAGRSAVL